MSNPVFKAIFEVTGPVPLVGTPWEFLGASPNVRSFPGDARGLVAILEEEFDADGIVDAGVAVRNADGSLTPARVLGEDRPEFLILREKKDLPPFGIVTNDGALANIDPPCFHANADWFTSARMAKNDQLFVVRSVVEVAVLRLLGLAATVVAGLDSMNGAQLRRLLGKPEVVSEVHFCRQDRLVPIRRRRDVSLVFVGFDLFHIQPGVPDSMHSVMERFCKITTAFEFDMSILHFWQPSEDDLQKLSLAAELSDVTLVKKAIRDSLNRSRKNIYCVEREWSQPVDLHSAEQALQREVDISRERNFPTRGLADAKVRFDRLFDEMVLDPLRDEAETTRDPVERPLLLRALELAEELHRTSPLVRIAAVAGTREDRRAADPLSYDEREKRRQSTTQLTDIFRKLRQKR